MQGTRKYIAELVGTFCLIFIGIGAIKAANGDLLAVAFAHGLAIAVMVSATGGISGGHLNPAVTFGVLVGGKIGIKDAFFYWVAQLLGASLAAYFCLHALGYHAVLHGTPDLADGITFKKGMAVEAVLTFFLVFVVYGTAVDARAPKIGGLAIGLTVTLDILFGGPITGGAMNPARTFGPALAISHWNNHLIYWIGPMFGGLMAGLLYGRVLIKTEN